MPEDLSHLDHLSDADPLQGEDSGDDPFLSAHGAEIELQPEYFAMIIHQAIRSRLAPLQTRGSADPEELKRLQKRNRGVVVARSWLPRTEREISLFADDPVRRLRDARKTRNGDPAVAVKKTYEAVIKFWQDSDERLGILDKALMAPEDELNGPDPEVIRHLLKTDDEYRSVFEDYFFEKEALDTYNWRKDKKVRKNYAAHLVQHMAHTAYPSYLLETYQVIAGSEEERLQAWTDKINEIHKLPFIQMMRGDRHYTPPSLNSKRHSRQRHVQNQEFNESAPAPTLKAPKEWAGFIMPKEVEEALKPTDEEQHRIDTLIHQSASPDVARRRVLGGKLPKTSEEIEREGVVEALKKLPQMSPRPKPKRPGIGIRADIANNDPKVEDQNRLFNS